MSSQWFGCGTEICRLLWEICRLLHGCGPLWIRVLCPHRLHSWSPWCRCNARDKPTIHSMVWRSMAWPLERLGVAVVPIRNPMARSRSSANGLVWVLVWAYHTIPGLRAWNANDCGNVIKVGKALRGASILLTNANGDKSSWTTSKEVRFGFKISSTFW